MVSPLNRAPSRIVNPSYIVSACLAGIDCTYKGGNKLNPRVKKLCNAGLAVPVCPEVMGGLPIPRENSEIIGGDGSSVLKNKARVVSLCGTDLSQQYISGSAAILNMAKKLNICKAILKSRSPACGVTNIYDGKFHKILKRGKGVLAAILAENGIEIKEI